MKSFLFLVVIGLALGTGEVKGQEFKLISETALPDLDEQFRRTIFFDPDDSSYIYYDEPKNVTIKSNKNIASEDGKYYVISPMEYVGAYFKNMAIIYDYADSTLKKVDIKAGKVIKYIKTNCSTVIYSIESDVIICSDQEEPEGTMVEVYSKNLDLISSIKPYEGLDYIDFSNFYFTGNKSSLILTFTREIKGEYPKCIVINLEDRKKLLNSFLRIDSNSEMKLLGTYFFEDKLLLWTFKNFILMNINGDIIFKTPVSWALLNDFVYDHIRKKVYFFDLVEKTLVSFGLEKGEFIISKNLPEYNNASPQRLILSDNGSRLFAFCGTNPKLNTEPVIFVHDVNLNLIDTIKIDTSCNPYNLYYNGSKQMTFISNNKIITYKIN